MVHITQPQPEQNNC